MTRIGLAVVLLVVALGAPDVVVAQGQRVTVASDEWALIGDLVEPQANGPYPAVLLLNQAAGSRAPYAGLATALRDRGIASLRLDMRGHGESTNNGQFVPGEMRRDPLIWDAEPDVAAALEFLAARPSIDATRLAVVGASYTAEEASESGRLHGYVAAYVLLSPGSLDEQSIIAMDDSGAAWLVVSAEEDRRLTEIMAQVAAGSLVAETQLLDGGGHATDLFEGRPELSGRIADWLSRQLTTTR